MKAVIISEANNLRIQEVADPIPGPGQVRVAMEYGGICGSDIAYWKSGISGTAVLKEPLILGHEVAGRIDMLGEDVKGWEEGQAVTFNPATLVGEHEVAPELRDRTNLWPEVRYFGSAAFMPHEQGGFSTYRVVDTSQLRAIPEGVSTREAAAAEPAGVAFHAASRVDVFGKRVLVNGVGPIGALVVAALKHKGAAEVIASDLSDASLEIAAQMGADSTINITREELPSDIEIAFDASGAPAATAGLLMAIRRGGTLVQVGNLPGVAAEFNLGQLVTREITWIGSYRFVDEVVDALDAMANGMDVTPLLTHEFAIDDAVTAFQTAADPTSGSSKVLLKLN